MRKPHLLSGALLVALLGSVACSREETRDEAREAASRARVAAARAGDQLEDSWLTTKIQAQYFADDNVKARNINVSTRDGVVVLTGNVDDARAREEAVQIARNTDGVREVEDRLVVSGAPPATAAGAGPAGRDALPPLTGPDPGATSGAVATSGTPPAMPSIVAVDDQAVTTRIQAKYFLDTAIKGRQIAVMTENGVVTLSGEVASDAERAQALLLARTTEGVQRVEDSLAVNASLTSGVTAPVAAPGDPSLSAPPANPAAPIGEPHDAPPEQR